uniref:Uncharacterized protein n=1 Tax=Pithovirus LCPAC401 TaxID=2506595 RepID=A0A481ZBJ3_9VIRU|nr:MAG: hypothetical protein LCPAC401_00870 [Pithovirus LCPAC401]
MNFKEYKRWIGEHAITKAEWEQMCVWGKRLQLLQPDYFLYQQLEGRSHFGKRYRTNKDDSIISIVCGSKMTEKEIDRLDYCGKRPTDGWHVTMKRKYIDDDESFNGYVFAAPDGIVNNGGSGNMHSRLMSLDIELPSMSEISYDD